MLSRRNLCIGAGSIGVTAIASGASQAAQASTAIPSASMTAQSGTSITHIEGPVTGGQRGHIFGGYYGTALTDNGYIEEEYFVSGVAQSFRAQRDLTPDGRWKVRPDARAAFTTRVIVHRPKNVADFNGILICEWANVSAFVDASTAVNERYHRSGFAYAAISAQWVGVEGLDSSPETGLRQWDPVRYGPLDHPGDGFSYDIFTQVARSLTYSRSHGASPLDGLNVKHCIATGQSQSAARLATYINAIHPVSNFFSGFIPTAHVGGGTELDNPEIIPGESKTDYDRRRASRLVLCSVRDDLEVPIVILQSETEARIGRVTPQPDSKWIRAWEVAGAVHGSASDVGYRADTSVRDGIKDPFAAGTQRMVRFMPTIGAASIAMMRWLEGGAPLPRHPRLLRGPDGRSIKTDPDGNAIGGARLPEVAVPTAVYETRSSPAWGIRTPFPTEKLRTLYPTDDVYLDLVTAATEDSVLGDLILPDAAAEYIDAAKDGPIPTA